MSKTILALMIAATCLATCLAGCHSDGSETPNQALQAMIDLYIARDFDTLVRTRYAEIAKAENDRQIQTLINRFRAKYRDNTELNLAIATYTTARLTTPALSADGTVATFKLSTGSMKLYRMPNGRWGFHL